MLEFREININDIKWVNELLKQSDFMGCEYSFANNMAWRRLNNSKICRYKDFYIVMSDDENMAFTFPAGSGDYVDVLSQMREYAQSRKKPFKIWNASESQIEYIRENFSDRFKVICDDTQYDYIYSAQDLIDMSGKKFHGKKNHINAFKKYNWSFSEITEKDFDDCIAFCVEDYVKNDRAQTTSGISEQFAIDTYFMNYRELELMGGLLRVDGNIAAVSIGERLNSDTLVVHIEKADTQYRGSYAAMCNEFAIHFAVGYKYINREEDLGIQGLRKSKRSYNPLFQLKKDIVIFK